MEVFIVALGGVDDVGANNAYFIRYGKDAILLDCGARVPSAGEENADEEDVDGAGLDRELCPDFDFIFEHDLNLLGVLGSHGHYDHIAAMPRLVSDWRSFNPTRKDPIFFGSRHTVRVLRIFEFNKMPLRTARSRKVSKRPLPSRVIGAGESFSLGPFEVQPFDVIHSIPGSLGFSIKVGGKHIVYTGDWKFSGFPDEVQALEEQIRSLEPVDVFLADSTGFDRPGVSDPDSVASDEICSIINEHPQGLVIITGFSSHSARWRRVLEWLKNDPYHSDRTRWFVGRSMYRYADAARIDEDLCRRHDNRNPRIKRGDILFVTGCQADDLTVMRRLVGDHSNIRGLGFKLEELEKDRDDAVIFSSSTIPKPEIESRVRHLMERIAAQGVSLYLPPGNPFDPTGSLENVTVCSSHTSGHAYQEEHIRMVELMKPRLIVPVHGERERRELAHDLFPDSEIKIVRTGEPVTLS